MKKIVLLLSVCITLISCSQSKHKEVEQSLRAFFDAMYAKDFVTARAYSTLESKEMIDLIETVATEISEEEKLEKPYLQVAHIQYINDSTATALISEKSEPNSVKITLKKRAEKWLVSFDKASLEKMLGQAQNESDSVDVDFIEGNLPIEATK